MQPKVNMKKVLGLLLSIVAYIVVASLPTPDGLDITGQRAIALMIASVIFWSAEVIPIGVSSIMLPMLTGVLGICAVSQTLQNFVNSTILFMVAAQLIASAFTLSGVGKRVSLKVSFLFGNKPQKVLLSFMLFTCICSMFLVDIPVAMMFGSIAYELLQKNSCEPGKSRFGMAMMIGIPVSAAIGGFGTPVGSGLNVLTLNTLSSVTDGAVTVNFLQWTAIGLPMAIILLLISWWLICKLIKPEIAIVKGSEDIKEQEKALGALAPQERKFLVIFGLTVLAWVTQPLTGLDNTLTSCISCAAMAFSGIELITWDKSKNFVGWDGIFLVGGATAIAMTMFTTGASTWVANIFSGMLSGMSVTMVIFLVCVFGILIHLIVPTGGALVALMIPIMATIASNIGISPAILALPIGFSVSNVLLIPLDPIPLTTYTFKYWKMLDMSKIGAVISVVWILLLFLFMAGANTIGFI